jgi:hypothetical protein
MDNAEIGYGTSKKHDEQARQTKVSQRKRKKRIADDHSEGVDSFCNLKRSNWG